VLIKTGFASRWPDAVKYLGTAERVKRRWRSSIPGCIPKRRMAGVEPVRTKARGDVDTASYRSSGSRKDSKTHRALTAHNIPAFEKPRITLDRTATDGGHGESRLHDEDRAAAVALRASGRIAVLPRRADETSGLLRRPQRTSRGARPARCGNLIQILDGVSSCGAPLCVISSEPPS
jgi:hypothetical protein